MLFNSIDFLFFFLSVTTLFFTLPHSFRWALLLVASCVFYMYFKPEYILILFGTIVIDYFAGILIERETDKRKKKLYLVASLISNVGVLAVFKYYNFLNGNITGICQWFGVKNEIPALTILLPIGLSFHTFQAMSYTIEVYRGKQTAERHFGIYSLYVMFYPQLVAGPIERPQNIIHQFREKKYFSYENAIEGINLIAYGLFKKIVVADRLAVYVNQVYKNIDNASTISAAIAACFFSIQIYCDFSGYSDIARGTAKFMGYDLMINFKRPYLAKSITEFWGRWHISLSTWFRDYLYIPLGGNRVRSIIWLRNLMIVFLISGLWHGANWTFIVWGALHGIYVLFELVIRKVISKSKSLTVFIASWLGRTICMVTVFVLVTFAWIFFRAENFKVAKNMIGKLLEFDFSLNLTQVSAEKGPINLALSFLVILILLLSYKLPENLFFKKNSSNIMFLFFILIFILFLGKDAGNEFIYFQF